jgi:predicted ArsR family transcriptional regulator
MNPPRPAAARRVSPLQIQVITAPRRLEILEAIQARGPSSAAEIARQLGRRPDSVHYHFNALCRAGFLRQARVRDNGRGRPAAIWEVSGPGNFSHRLEPRSAASRGAWTATAAALLRAASRDLAQAVAAGAVRDSGPRRNADVSRRKAWLTDQDLLELGRRLAALEAFLASRAQPGRGRLHVLTLAYCPATTP